MSFQVYLPICPLQQFLSLSLCIFHIYFKLSSFCLCHTSLQSLSLVLCQPAKASLFPSPQQPTYHLLRLASSCFLLSFFPWGELVKKKASRFLEKQMKGNWSLWQLLFTNNGYVLQGRKLELGYQSEWWVQEEWWLIRCHWEHGPQVRIAWFQFYAPLAERLWVSHCNRCDPPPIEHVNSHCVILTEYGED